MDVCKFYKKECMYEKDYSIWQSPTNHCKCYPIIPHWRSHTCIVCIECEKWQ